MVQLTCADFRVMINDKINGLIFFEKKIHEKTQNTHTRRDTSNLFLVDDAIRLKCCRGKQCQKI